MLSEKQKKIRDRNIERIARDICWYEFSFPRSGKQTKAEYWNGVCAEKKDEYRRDAKNFVFWLGRLPIGTLNLAHDTLLLQAPDKG